MPRDVLCRIEDDFWSVSYVTEFLTGRANSTRASTFRRVEFAMELGCLSLGSSPDVKNEEAPPDTESYETADDESV